jgi:predicted nucleic acid-binding protein
VIVADSSAWVELMRETESPVHRTFRRALEEGEEVAITEVVLMELLAGARPKAVDTIRARLLAFPVLPLAGLDAFERAAQLFRICRDAGETIRRTTDCLIAVPTIGAGASLLSADRDFEVLARHTPLRLEPLID